ncbi:unnamed protein product [Lactuca virosa]|uniref:Uncharacterized protein n=1 Tax=Lactuca virosa TaxID=75947 RepID=A0AAU9PGM8_9ASTR|nr:unnamed protein product [Lactuca virosa]
MYMKFSSFKLLLIGGEVVEEEGEWEKEHWKLERLSSQLRTTDTILMSGIEAKLTSVKVDGGGDVEFVKCECCGLTEECTPTYIATVRESNQGRWICGLCTEAVKEEMERSCSESEEEALDRHMRFCKNFRSSVSSPPSNPTEELISAVKQLLFRSLDSPRAGEIHHHR